MTKLKKALLAALPAAALVIGGGVGIAAAAGEPAPPVTEQVTSTVQHQQQGPGYGDQLRLRDGTCDQVPDRDQLQDRDQLRDRDQIHDPVQERLHDWLADR
ncbi:hypothetical protein [Amycolatopsis alkalitolerans]|uniref:Secreted protein n=1 Tax=Amycolatopsis alkalitolerans TaxID=2547244 RepID=A0A5C4M0D6_9PSEU|nr:hypothetical protein [Amycolatopsis alkalitolerans]TNC24140.1 hypothetical protein FG385_18965 [Amycolatopsis alkalitolerans]